MTLNRILIIGLGSIGKRHLRLIRALLPEADIRILRHQPGTSVPRFADGCFSNLNEALAFEPQLAVIANPSTYHLDSALPLAKAGAHLFIEKPMAASVKGIPQLMKISRSQKSLLTIGYNLRFLPSLQFFREQLKQGIIGKVLSVRSETGQYLPSWRPDTDYRQGVSARKALGGGVLLELSHEIDYVRWIFGDIEWVSASLIRQSSLDIDVEDIAHLIAGISIPAEDSVLVANINLDFIRHDPVRCCTAIGEQGSLRWNGLKGEVSCYRADDNEWQSLFYQPHQPDESYLAQWQHILNCIKNGTPPLVSGEDGYRALQIITAARKSTACCQRIMIEEAKFEYQG
ncbi:MAG: Gfo/Idh/MocA family oxidoreductase [Desulfamplus sp.]|nr:Gfo/Idh/MocA family oxidoreductase [Desulfamplus sp.]